MRRLLTLTTVAVMAASGSAIAQKPNKPGKGAVSIKTSVNILIASQPVTITGSVKGAAAGVTVVLQRHAPGATTFADQATVTTDAQGNYSTVQRPRVNTVYRVVAKTAPEVASGEQTVSVRPLIGLTPSDSTPRKGQVVTLRGSVRPAHDGRSVSIQRKRPDGTWAQVTTARLADAGSVYSTYRKRLTIRATAVYRVVLADHADHAEGVSRERTLTIH
jgi:hypothetical protein